VLPAYGTPIGIVDVDALNLWLAGSAAPSMRSTTPSSRPQRNLTGLPLPAMMRSGHSWEGTGDRALPLMRGARNTR
jgi:hypothetical protein